MPKIRVKERDLTTNPLVGTNPNYILYVLSEKQRESWASSTGKPYYSALQTKLSVSPFEITLEEAKNFEEALQINTHFLSKAIELGGRIIISYDWVRANEYCSDRNQYDIKFILAKEGEPKGLESEEGDEEEALAEEDTTAQDLNQALTIAQNRKDCVVVYTKRTSSYGDKEKESLSTKCSYIGEGTAADADKKFFSDEVKQPAGKYVLSFYAQSGIHEVGVNGERPELEAGEAYILAFLYNVYKGRAEWLAVAGSVRGEVPGSYEVDGFLKESKIDNMQLRTYDANNSIAINPIVNMQPWGTRIWGNRTCLPNTNVTTDGKVADSTNSNVAPAPTDQLVASSFANIRIAICDIKKAIYKASRKYQFEQNTDVLWVNFTSSVNSLLEEMKSSYGIVGYRWKRDSANEQRGELRAILQITPIEAVEDFTLTLELKDSLDNTVQIAE